jgi:hypothetical protein
MPVTTLRVNVSTSTGAKERLFTCSRSNGNAACRAALLVPELAREPVRTCLEIYGGSASADILGFVHGQPVALHVTRSNSCEIARWDRLGALLGRGAAA